MPPNPILAAAALNDQNAAWLRDWYARHRECCVPRLLERLHFMAAQPLMKDAQLTVYLALTKLGELSVARALEQMEE